MNGALEGGNTNSPEVTVIQEENEEEPQNMEGVVNQVGSGVQSSAQVGQMYVERLVRKSRTRLADRHMKGEDDDKSEPIIICC